MMITLIKTAKIRYMTDNDALEKELAFFNRNKAGYLKEYKNKYLLIKGEELIGYFDTNEAAYEAGIQKYGNVPFLIKQVLEHEPTLTISSVFMGTANANL